MRHKTRPSHLEAEPAESPYGLRSHIKVTRWQQITSWYTTRYCARMSCFRSREIVAFGGGGKQSPRPRRDWHASPIAIITWKLCHEWKICRLLGDLCTLPASGRRISRPWATIWKNLKDAAKTSQREERGRERESRTPQHSCPMASTPWINITKAKNNTALCIP